jgi:hypothetical protein
MGFPEGKLERLQAARILVEQVTQVRRGIPRVSNGQEHVCTAIMPDRRQSQSLGKGIGSWGNARG